MQHIVDGYRADFPDTLQRSLVPQRIRTTCTWTPLRCDYPRQSARSSDPGIVQNAMHYGWIQRLEQGHYERRPAMQLLGCS